jgi:hypothetical protein
MFLVYPYDRELGNKYIINIGSGLIYISEVLVICFIRQNLVLGFVGQSLILGLVEYISLSTKGFIFGCPKIISSFLVIE